MSNDVIVVTGGAGFIGSAVIRHLIREGLTSVVNVDALAYAANPASLAEVDGHPRYRFERVDIRSAAEVDRIFGAYRPTAVLHLAAETHVDRSIDEPRIFVETNVLGTATLLESAYRYWRSRLPAAQPRFRFHHVSTDEVFGSLGPTGCFNEDSPYHPSSPYAASKAGADHLVRAWRRTYGLPTIISNSSNNFGPYQHPEKFIPLMILSAFQGRPMPIYGRGENVRDWLFVDDHARALAMILRRGRVGDSYNVGGGNERRNIDIAVMICDLVDELAPPLPGRKPRRELVAFVADRPGHDARYAVDARKIRDELGWKPRDTFESAHAARSSGTSRTRLGRSRCGQEQALRSSCDCRWSTPKTAVPELCKGVRWR
jgi:dTDP-glucose 4,6-dehydratase